MDALFSVPPPARPTTPAARAPAALPTAARGRWPGLLAFVLATAALVLGLVTSTPATAVTGPAADALSGDGLLVADGADDPPAVSAQAWLVADADTGEVLAAQNPSQPLAMASTLKLLTALALAPQLDAGTPYTATPADAEVDGSKVGLVPGSTYSVDDLLHGLMLGSGNDAATAVAAAAGGQQPAVRTMQALAEDLGADDTVVRNTSGLDHPEQVTTAHDLAVIGRAALEEPWLVELAGTRTYDFPGRGSTEDAGREHFQIANHNGLLGSFEGALGLKTGYTQAARHSFVGAAERDGRRYVVSVLKAEGGAWRHGGTLLDWAFAQPATVEPVGVLPGAPEDPPAAVAADAAVGAATVAAGVVSSESTPRWLVVAVPVGSLAAAVVALRARVLLRRARRRRAALARRHAAQPPVERARARTTAR